MKWYEKKPNNLPWMLTCDEDKWHTASIDMATVKEIKIDIGDKTGIDCLECEMEQISWNETEDGVHQIPFWAVNAFIEISNVTEEDHDFKGWQKLKFMRTKTGRINTASFREAS